MKVSLRQPNCWSIASQKTFEIVLLSLHPPSLAEGSSGELQWCNVGLPPEEHLPWLAWQLECRFYKYIRPGFLWPKKKYKSARVFLCIRFRSPAGGEHCTLELEVNFSMSNKKHVAIAL